MAKKPPRPKRTYVKKGPALGNQNAYQRPDEQRPEPKRGYISALRQLRIQMGLRQLDVSSLSGVGLDTVRKLEDGSFNVRLYDMLCVSGCLGLSCVDLYPGLAYKTRFKARIAPGDMAAERLADYARKRQQHGRGGKVATPRQNQTEVDRERPEVDVSVDRLPRD